MSGSAEWFWLSVFHEVRSSCCLGLEHLFPRSLMWLLVASVPPCGPSIGLLMMWLFPELVMRENQKLQSLSSSNQKSHVIIASAVFYLLALNNPVTRWEGVYTQECEYRETRITGPHDFTHFILCVLK